MIQSNPYDIYYLILQWWQKNVIQWHTNHLTDSPNIAGFSLVFDTVMQYFVMFADSRAPMMMPIFDDMPLMYRAPRNYERPVFAFVISISPNESEMRNARKLEKESLIALRIANVWRVLSSSHSNFFRFHSHHGQVESSCIMSWGL